MNTYINAQILNMITITKTFEQACELAALKDDSKLSRQEAQQLKKIKSATAKFRRELEEIK